MRKRGELDALSDLIDFANRLEQATVEVVESGRMTGDLARITSLPSPTTLSTEDFILAIAEQLRA